MSRYTWQKINEIVDEETGVVFSVYATDKYKTYDDIIQNLFYMAYHTANRSDFTLLELGLLETTESNDNPLAVYSQNDFIFPNGVPEDFSESFYNICIKSNSFTFNASAFDENNMIYPFEIDFIFSSDKSRLLIYLNSQNLTDEFLIDLIETFNDNNINPETQN